DYVDQHPRWVAYKKTDLAYAAAVRAGGGTVDVINLPDMGIKGNSHMLMQDKNNAEIADVIQKWMVGKGLVEWPRFDGHKASSFEKRREGGMRRLGIVLALGLAAGSAWAQGKEPIALRDMGSFHVGGRVIEITGQPIKEIVFTPGGVPAKMDPNG